MKRRKGYARNSQTRSCVLETGSFERGRREVRGIKQFLIALRNPCPGPRCVKSQRRNHHGRDDPGEHDSINEPPAHIRSSQTYRPYGGSMCRRISSGASFKLRPQMLDCVAALFQERVSPLLLHPTCDATEGDAGRVFSRRASDAVPL